ncbi:MAG: N-acetylneuraminate synthase family protein [Bacteroidia bacterium]|nr:N-acetylneuraminate synthase family protein [Bacteroidia bacterium]
MAQVEFRNIIIGDNKPCFIIAEIGINHNGDLTIAKKLIEEAYSAGCNAVKFQKRVPELCVPQDQWDIERDTPWGRMKYIDYRHKVELDYDAFSQIHEYCKELGIIWFASCWDESSVDFIESFNPPLYKASSASLTDLSLLKKMKSTGKPLIISTGMSTMEEIDEAVAFLGMDNLLIAHSTSSYPCPIEELNLKMIPVLRNRFPEIPIGYSGHETGLSTTSAAVILGASFIERHFTLDRAMWGSDQSASVEPVGMQRLVRDIRANEKAIGDGIKKIYPGEINALNKLRRIKKDNPTIA